MSNAAPFPFECGHAKLRNTQRFTPFERRVALPREIMQVIKGMVQVLGTTYRVVRIQPGSYEVTRIHDEVVVGCFACGQIVQVTSRVIDDALMRQIARAAVQQGRTSWMGAAQRPF